MSLVVDLDVLLANFRTGESFLAKRLAEREAAGDHVGSDHRVAGLYGKGVAQFHRVRSGRGESWKLDGREAILGAWVCREDHAQHRVVLLGSRLDRGVIITLAAQPLRPEVRVGTGAAAGLRRTRRILALGL